MGIQKTIRDENSVREPNMLGFVKFQSREMNGFWKFETSNVNEIQIFKNRSFDS